MTNSLIESRFKKGGLRPVISKVTESSNDQLVSSQDITSDVIVRVINGPVRVEVYNKLERSCVSAEIFYADTEFPLFADTGAIPDLEIREIRVVALSCIAQIDCYERNSYEQALIDDRPDKYRMYAEIQQRSVLSIFTAKKYFRKKNVKLTEPFYNSAVRMLFKYLVGQVDPKILMMEFKNAKTLNASCKLKLIHLNRQDEFAAHCGMSPSAWSTTKTLLIERGIRVVSPNTKENYAISVNVIELIKQHSDVFNEVINEVDEQVNQFIACG